MSGPAIPVQVGEHNYVIGKMHVILQSDVLRKLLPVLARSAPILGVIREMMQGGSPNDALAKIDLALPMFDALARMSQEDSHFVMISCLSVVQRQLGGGTGFAPVVNQGRSLQFDDLGLIEMYKLIWLVIEKNFMSFF